MSDDLTTTPAADESRLTRLARRVARHGLPGALLAFLLLRLDAVLPVLVLQFHSAKVFPVALLCCAEVGWLFGGTVGLLVAAQWLVHELAHIHAAQRIGLRPGWRSFIPLVGVYSGTLPSDFSTRENEAEVALAGVVAGLVAAIVGLALGRFVESTAVIVAAKAGFALTLINLMPFRPFDGGRIFPGYLWRYADDLNENGSDAASHRFIAGCRAAMAYPAPDPAHESDTRGMLIDLIHRMFYGAAGLLTGCYLLLPPVVLALAMLTVFCGFWLFFGAMLALDPSVVATPPTSGLQPREAGRSKPFVAPDLPWRNRRTVHAALAIYTVALTATIVGLTF